MAACGSVAAIELLASGAANASARDASASRISVIGDSLTSGTLPYQPDALSTVGWEQATIDSYVSRGIRSKVKADRHTGLTSIDAIRATAGDSDLWVVALGTNDAGIYSKEKHADLINMMMERIGAGHYVMWVNVYLPGNKARQQHWNSALETVAAGHQGEMFVLDWATLAAENRNWMLDDGIHCSAKGYMHRATAIASATRSLIPPVAPSATKPGRVWSQIPTS
ncbi:MAG TPA: GDSL-type esterase/lipase family protein [Ilumatobacteraceae bacterium]